MKLTKNEEDYLKALFHLIVEQEEEKPGTNMLADYLGISPASVNGMLKKLKSKSLVHYEKYGKLELTSDGHGLALRLIRKHRLWETFLHDHMNFTWDEVHDVAEQMEHIKSEKLIEELEKFLGFPKVDPHGAVIPTASGEYKLPPKVTLSEMEPGQECRLKSVKDGSVAFLQYVTKLGLELSSKMKIIERQDFDDSLIIEFDDKKVAVSKKFADNVFVEEVG